MSENLKPCPFCGSTNQMVLPPTCDRSTTPYDPNDRAFPIVRCFGCITDVSGKDFDASGKTAIEAWNRRASLPTKADDTDTRGSEPTVKALHWHKSHMDGWNGDWHTTTPFIYTVRCADENGWKWSFPGSHGYAPSPELAKAYAQADYERRVISALSPNTETAP